MSVPVLSSIAMSLNSLSSKISPAFQAFYEFGVFFTGHDLHAGMLTLIHFASLIGGWRRRGWSHNPGNKAEGFNTSVPEFSVF